MLIKRSSLPAPTRGAGAVSVPRVNISGQGQILFSKLVSKAFNGIYTLAAIEWDEAKRTMVITPITETALPKNVTKEDLFEVKTGKGKVDAGRKFIGGSGVLNQLKYGFKAVGSQSFNATVNEKKGNQISFVLPESSTLTVHVPKKRAPKVAVNGTGTVDAANAATAGAGGAGASQVESAKVEEPDLVMA